MRLRQLLSIGLLTAFGLSAIATVASAVPVGRFINSPDPAFNDGFVATGLTPYTDYTLIYGGTSRDKTFTANECGFFKIAGNSTTWPIGTTIVLNGVPAAGLKTVADLPVEPSLKCSKGVSSGNDSPSSAFKNSEVDIFVTGADSFAKKVVGFPNLLVQRKVKSNACGQIVAKPAGKYYSDPDITLKQGLTDVLSASTAVAGYSFPQSATVTVVPKCSQTTEYLPGAWPTTHTP